MKIETFTKTKRTVELENSTMSFNQNPIGSLKAGSRQLFLLAMGLILVCAINPAKAQNDTIQVDFGIEASPANWNFYNSYAIDFDMPALINSKGVATTVGTKTLGAFVNQKADGTTSPDLLIGIPGAVTKDYFYSSNLANAQLEIRGLDPTKDYTFIVFASKMANGNREGKYTFTGTTEGVCTLNPNNNASNIATTTAKPTALGTISFKTSAGPNNTDGSGVHHLNALKIVYAKS